MATKLGRMIDSLDGLLPIMSHYPLITWSCDIRGSLTGGGSARKRLNRHRLLVNFKIILKRKHFCLLKMINFFLTKHKFISFD